jgi:hypothetical protein
MLDLPQTKIDVRGVLARNILLDKENLRLLDLLRVQGRQLAELRGEDPDQTELAILGSLKTLDVEIGKQPEPAKQKAAGKAKQRGHGPTVQPKLAQIEVTYNLCENDRVCFFCQENTMVPMVGQTEDSEVITVEMKRVLHLHQRRQKYRCSCNGAIRTAPAPKRLIPVAATQQSLQWTWLYRSTSITFRWNAKLNDLPETV